MSVWNDLRKLQVLAKDLRYEEQSPQVILALANLLNKKYRVDQILRRALLDHPRDFWLHFNQGIISKDPVEQIGCYRAARSFDPRPPRLTITLGLPCMTKRICTEPSPNTTGPYN